MCNSLDLYNATAAISSLDSKPSWMQLGSVVNVRYCRRETPFESFMFIRETGVKMHTCALSWANF